MNLSIPGFDMTPSVREKSDASQWFTPMPIARRMVAWAGAVKPHSILEPSAGSGNLVAACRERWERAEIDAVELDGHYWRQLLATREVGEKTTVWQGDFLTFRPVFDDLYDLAVMNPPYEGGLDGRFLAHAMDLSDRVIALVRLTALVGQARTEAVWSRCQDDGDFALIGIALFAGRPRFEAGRAIGDREDGGSAKTDFCVVKMRRRKPDEMGKSIATQIEWWMP